MNNRLYHHGILGQKWGVQNGPPYPLRGGRYDHGFGSVERKETPSRYNIYNKKHFDKIVKKDTVLSTLSYDPNRTSNTDLFFAAFDKTDKAHYMALFNHPLPKPVVDENGKEIGSSICFKAQINNKVTKDMKVASEDSGAEAFKKLYENSRDFYNFVTDKSRMRAAFSERRYMFRGYREARDVLEKMDKPGYTPTDSDLTTVYRMFNYIIPYGDPSNPRLSKDVLTQRTKLFRELKNSGYDALLDVNDAIYGGYKANAPVIVFNMEAFVLDAIKSTNAWSKRIAKLEYAGRKILGL